MTECVALARLSRVPDALQGSCVAGQRAGTQEATARAINWAPALQRIVEGTLRCAWHESIAE